jgi:predicted dinucleotide-binding enzyme
MLSFSRDQARLAASAERLGARAGTVAEAAEFGEIVVLATPWTATEDALKQISNLGRQKILWDCTNPLKPDLSGLLVGTTTSGAEEIAKIAPWARVVKAIPPFAEVLHSPSLELDGKRQSVFVCGDDQEARLKVANLIRDIGAEPVDAGPLTLARFAEPAAMLLVRLAYAYGYGVRIGVSFIREAAQSNAG